LAELLQPERPAMRVLYMSGYTDDTIVRQGILDNAANFLQKPFSIASLAAKVRASLDDSAVAPLPLLGLTPEINLGGTPAIS